jgi:hypothetical protein
VPLDKSQKKQATSATLWTAEHLFRRAARSPLFAMEDDMGLQALGSEKVRDMAAKFGIPVDKVADLLAKHLPTAIDKATPQHH